MRAGLALLGKTLRTYPKDAGRSIAGAVLWMAMVVAIPYVVKIIVDEGITAGRLDILGPLAVLLVVLGVIQAIGIGTRRYFGFRFSYRAEADLRNRMFGHMQRLAFAFHDQTSTGQLMARASSDLSQVRLVFAMLPITIANVMMFVTVMIVLVVIDPVLGLAASLMIPILFFTANRYAGKIIGLSFEVQERLADLSQVVEEAVGGIQVVKAYGQEEQEQRRLEDAAEGIYTKTLRIARWSTTFGPLFEVIPAAGTVLILWLGGVRVVDGVITIGEFIAFLQYLAVLVLPIRITGWFFANLPRGTAAGTRVEDFLAEDVAIDDPQDPVVLSPGPGEVRFEGVCFAYPNGEPVLNGIDLTIPGGSSVALVGVTGSGKTTLAHLIPRFHDVGLGAITLDGVDIRSLALEQLRQEVAVVFQETFLFSASVRANIGVGDPNAGDEQVRAAARLAQAHGFICELPEAYDTIVGERGHSLSGGQRQRVALARAVVRDPRVLILDDATSSVDAVVEAEIQAALRHVMEGRTTIIVAHRTSTLALADHVVFLEGGAIAAVGTHDELMATVPRYGAVLASTNPAGGVRGAPQ